MPFDQFPLDVRRELVEMWNQRYAEPTDIQVRCLSDHTLLSGANTVILAPTSSGKTLVGEILAVRAACRLERALYVVPYKAIVHEKYLDFRGAYSPHGISVVASSGDYDEYDGEILRGNFDIAVVIIEKLVQLLTQNRGILGNCALIVIDEVQLIREEQRGPGLEMLLTWIRRQPTQPQIVCLSATVGDLNEFDKWLDSRVIASTDRPVPLECSVVGEDALDVVSSELAQGRQVLVFVPTVIRTESMARAIAAELPPVPVPDETRNRMMALEDSPTRDVLNETMARRVGFHSRALSADERRVVEDSFRSRFLQCLVSTSTLALGVNLPADSVVVTSAFRSIQRTQHPIEVSEWLNCAGRAGRLGLGERGRAYLCADDKRVRDVEDRYLNAQPEGLDSAIPQQRGIAEHVLRAIAAGLAQNVEEARGLFESSYAAAVFYKPQALEEELAETVTKSVGSLVEADLAAQTTGGQLAVTPLGVSVAHSGMSVSTALGFVHFLHTTTDTLNEGAAMLAIANAEEFAESRPFTTYGEDARVYWSDRAAEAWPELEGIGSGDSQPPAGQRTYKRALMLADWANGVPLADIHDRYDVSHGHVRDAGETAAWLCQGLISLSGALRPTARQLGEDLRRLSDELHFGVRHPGTEFMRLRVPSLRRNDAHRLVNNDIRRFRTLANVLDAQPSDFRRILGPQVAQALQGAILTQIGESFDRRIRAVLHSAREVRISRIQLEILERFVAATGTDLDEQTEHLLKDGVGLDARRVLRQPLGQGDVIIYTDKGQIVVGCTATEGRPVTWTKVREVLGATDVIHVITYIVLGRPEFHSDAVEATRRLPEEQPLVLITVDTLASVCLEMMKGDLVPEAFLAVLESRRGLLSQQDFSPQSRE